MFFQLTFLACLLVGSLSAYQPGVHHPRQPFAVAPAAPVATNFKCADMPYPVGLFADTQANCEVFHYCNNQDQHTFSCGEGTAFNQKTMTCDYPQNFTCADSNKYFAQNAGIGVETGLAAPVVPKTSFTCQGKPYLPGLYADEETGCSVYHVCTGNEQHDFVCGEGTVFSQELLTCTYANEVNCQQSAQFYENNDPLNRATNAFCKAFPRLCKRPNRSDPDFSDDQFNIINIGNTLIKQLRAFCRKNPNSSVCKALPK